LYGTLFTTQRRNEDGITERKKHLMGHQQGVGSSFIGFNWLLYLLRCTLVYYVLEHGREEKLGSLKKKKRTFGGDDHFLLAGMTPKIGLCSSLCLSW
jgi:hypothetical protein